MKHTRKVALLIGINYTGTSNALSGCISDIEKMETILRQRGFAEITTLKDQTGCVQPTRANIINALTTVCKSVHPGDILYIHYSGHGSQLRANNRDEADYMDETWCPVDCSGSLPDCGYIRDNDLFDIVSKNAVGAKVVVVSDSCHSGSVLDLPYSWAVGSYINPENRHKTTGDIVCISGCRDSQTSADTFEDGSAQGACSWAMRKALKSLTNPTWKDLLQEMRSILSKRGYQQYPILSMSTESLLTAPLYF